MYDITDAMSFENLSDWLSKAEMYGSESAVKVLVGTKADLVETGSGSNRAVAVEQVAGLAHSLGCEFFETSAKSNLNVDQVFSSLAALIVSQRMVAPQATAAAERVRITAANVSPRQERQGCC